MIFLFLLILCAVNTLYAKEGDSCTKDGVPGVCTILKQCPAALEDLKKYKRPQHCELGAPVPIVCCVSSTAAERPHKGKCVLPPYPEHGTYVTNVPNGKPGEAYDIFLLNVTCIDGYVIKGEPFAICQDGWWPVPMPECIGCTLKPDPSVMIECLVPGSQDATRPCKEVESNGTVARGHCRPFYHTYYTLPIMRCIDGSWNYVAKCMPDCGKTITTRNNTVLGGEKNTVGHEAVPWHALIYLKTREPYWQICVGSLVSTKFVISAAHCFWDEVSGKQPAASFAVAVGKVHRAWRNPDVDRYAQFSDITSIDLPPRYQGRSAHYQDDIAVLTVSTPFTYTTFVSPVCLDFDVELDTKQLKPDKSGKVAGWGTSKNGSPADVLKVINIPYVTLDKCFAELPRTVFAFITNDKFCAGAIDVSAFVSKNDSGGGYAIYEEIEGIKRYFLRGVFSFLFLSEHDDEIDNTKTYSVYTHIVRHEHFIRDIISEDI